MNNTNAATMTLADFVTEAELYHYSKERFELIKECNEFELMSMCLASTEYVTENADLINAEMIDNLSVLTESGNVAEAGDLKNKAGSKLKNIWGMVTRSWNKIINAILAMVGRLTKFVNERGKRQKSTINFSAVGKMTDQEKNEACHTIKKILSDPNTDHVQWSKTCKFGYATNISPRVKKNANNILNALAEAGGETFDAAERDMFAVIISASDDGLDVRIPKFADTVIDIAPRLAILTRDFPSGDNGTEPSPEAVKKLTKQINAMSKELKRLNPTNEPPTIDSIHKVTVLRKPEQIEAKHAELIKVKEEIVDNLQNVGKLNNPDVALFAARSELNKAVAAFIDDFKIYSGVAIATLANAIDIIRWIDSKKVEVSKVLPSESK